MDRQICELLLRKLQERIDSLKDHVVSGAVADYAAYQNIVGQVRGLAAAQMEIDDLLRKLKEAENDD